MVSQAAPRSQADATAEVIFDQEPLNAPRSSKLPMAQTIAYTLKISTQFLTSAIMGDGSIRRSDELLAWWSEKIFQSGNAKLSAEGREKIAPDTPYVFMSNHRSLLDIPASIAATPQSVRMVMKQELTKVPVWGRAMVASGFVPIDRKNRDKAIEQLERAKEHLAQGVSIWVFPEGTRSRDGSVGPFKKGGFHVARQLGLQIVPTWIEGTQDAVPPDTFDVTYHQHCHLRFGDPIATKDRPIEDVMEDVRGAIEGLRPEASSI